MATPTPPARSRTLDYDHQLATARQLLEFARNVCSGTIHTEEGFARKDYVFFALADKCFATHQAIQLLCMHSLVDDAFALVRVLIECIINGVYISQMNDQIADDYADYPDYREWLEFDQLRGLAPEMTSDTTSEEIEEMERKHENLRKRYERNRNQDWCADHLFERARKTDAIIGSDSNLMRILVNAPWRKASVYVHGTAASITSRVREEESGVVIRRQFQSGERGAVLYAANMAMFILLAVVDIRLGRPNREQWSNLYQNW